MTEEKEVKKLKLNIDEQKDVNELNNEEEELHTETLLETIQDTIPEEINVEVANDTNKSSICKIKKTDPDDLKRELNNAIAAISKKPMKKFRREKVRINTLTNNDIVVEMLIRDNNEKNK